MATVSKPSSYAVDVDSNATINHLNYTRSFMSPDKNTGFALPTTEKNEYSQVVDAEAEAEAAASAVAVAAISNEDVIQSHSVLGSGGINGDDTHSIPTTSGQ